MQALSDPGLKAGQSVASKEYDLTVKNRTTGMGHMEEKGEILVPCPELNLGNLDENQES